MTEPVADLPPQASLSPREALRHLLAAAAEGSALTVLRWITFLAAILVAWVTLKPFPDLGNPEVADLATGQEALTYATFGGLAVAALALTLRRHGDALRSLASPTLLALGAWLAVSVVLSQDSATSAKRLALTGAVMIVTACLPLLAGSRTELRNLLAVAALALLTLCYLGLALMPDVAIHQASDVVEPMLAGNWRGTFGHKNAAAAVMAMLIFVGIAVARSGLITIGCAIVALAAAFLIGSEGKSAFALVLATLAITSLFGRVRSLPGRVALTLGPLALINLFSVGTVMNRILAGIVQSLPVDATFTGRTDVWSYAYEAVTLRPLTGYGFAAFWNNAAIRVASDDDFTWAGYAAHSHNSYLDTAVTLGLPGLVLTFLVFVAAPLRDFQRLTTGAGIDRSAIDRNGIDPLAMLFLRIWCFGVLLSSMESFFYDRADPVWLNFAFAVFGLHYLARFRSR